MKKLLALATWLNLIDSQAKLSLTNIALYVVLVKLSLTTNISLTECGALLLALLNYSHKRYVVSKTPPPVEPLNQKIEAEVANLKEQVGKITLGMGMTGRRG